MGQEQRPDRPRRQPRRRAALRADRAAGRQRTVERERHRSGLSRPWRTDEAVAGLLDQDGQVIAAGPYNSIDVPSEGLIAVCRDYVWLHRHPWPRRGADEIQECRRLPGRLAAVVGERPQLRLHRPQGQAGAADALRQPRSPRRTVRPGTVRERAGAGRLRLDIGASSTGPAPGRSRLVHLFAMPFDNGFAPVQIKTGTGHVRRDGSAIDFAPGEVDTVRLAERPCGAPLAKSTP